MRTPGFDLELPEGLALALDRLTRERVAALPLVSGLASAAVGRWLLRVAQARARERWPLLRWSGSLLRSPERLEDACAQAAGAWVMLEGAEAPPEALTRVSRGVWTAGEAAPICLSRDLLERVQAWDRHHAADTDPALDGARQVLLAHCASAGVVWISGAPGSGRRGLAQWAHAASGEGSLLRVARDSRDRAAVGRWALFEELGELDPLQVSQLEARLDAPDPPARAVSAGVTRPHHPAFRAIVGRSPALAEVLHLALAAARSTRPALILGEPGVGKEGMARALHEASGRAGPMHAIDLGAVPEELLESELFGHARGAFTGADRARLGAFRSAEGGTLLLDEIGNLSLRMQARLLRVLAEQKVQPVGEDRPLPVNVRVLAATNADLETLARRGEFREDLYQRLATFILRIPPLRERPDDVLPLARHLLARERGAELPEPWATPEVEDALQSWRWPGNVRELEGRMALAAALAPPGGTLTLAHLSELDPRLRRPVPTLVTGEDGVAARLPRRLWASVSAVSLRIPALSDRPEAWRRDRVLQALEGLLLTREALELLVGAPWWGGLRELGAVASALRARAEEGVVDGRAVREVLPDLGSAGSGRPILLRVDPYVNAAGELGGLLDRSWSRCLVLGRVSGPREAMEALGDREPERTQLRQLLGAETPGFLRLGWLPQVPRVAALLTRESRGLRLQVLGPARVEVWGGPLAPGVPLARVTPGAPRSLGVAGEVQLRDPARGTLLRVLVAEGAAALEAHVEEALARLEPRAPAPTRTGETFLGAALNPGVPPPSAPPSSPRAPAPGRGRWVLSEVERAALNELLLAFPGGVFKTWVLERVAGWGEVPETRRLAGYLREAPNLADYVGRLYELDDNQLLREELHAQLASRADRARVLLRLPTRVQRLMEEGA